MLSFEAFRNPNLRRVFVAQMISQICDKLMLVGVIWYIASGPGPESSQQAIAWFIAFGALPHLLFTLSAPRWISRLGGPLRAVILTDWVRGAGFVAVALGLSRVDRQLILPALFVLSFFSNALGCVFNPAILSLPPQLTSDWRLRRKANALIESCFSTSAVIAPVFSTLIYAASGLRGLLLVNGLSYLFAAYVEGGVRIESGSVSPEARSTADRSSAEGSLAFLRQDSLLVWMLFSFLCMNLLLGPVAVFLPLYSKQIYSGSIGTLALLETGLGIGSLVGAVTLSVLHLKQDAWHQVIMGLGMESLCYLGFTLSRVPWFGAVSLGLMGFGIAIANVAILGFFQDRTKPGNLTSLMSCCNLIGVASYPVSMSVVGFILRFESLSAVALSCSVLLLGVTLLTMASPAWARAKVLSAEGSP